MARIKITAYVTPDIADTLKRVAAIEDRSISDIIEGAIVRRLTDTGHEAEHAALMARLDQIIRRLGVVEKGQHTHFEFATQTSRFLLSIAPEIAESDRPALSARGADRLRNILQLVVSRSSSDGGALQDALAGAPAASAQPAVRATQREAVV